MTDKKIGIIYDFPSTIEQKIRLHFIQKSKTLLKEDEHSLIAIYDTNTADENTLDSDTYQIIRTEIYNKNGVIFMSQYVMSLIGYPEFEEYDKIMKMLADNELTQEYSYIFQTKECPPFDFDKWETDIARMQKECGGILTVLPIKIIDVSFKFRGFKVVAEQYEMHRDRETFHNHL